MTQPSDLQASINSIQWTNGARGITGATILAILTLIFSIFSGMGTWVNGVYTPSSPNLTPFGFATLEGVVTDGVTDETPALNAAFTSVANGGVVKLPCGFFKVTGQLAINIAAGQRVTLQGSGFCTVLAFQGTNGILASYGNPYSGFSLSDLTLQTNAAGGYTGLTLSQSATNANPALSGQTTVRDVVFTGDDGGSPTPAHYWSVGIAQSGVSNVNIDNPVFIGANKSGTFLTTAGLSAASPAVLTNVKNLIAVGCGTGVVYGAYYQGMTLVDPNITSCNYGVSIPSYITSSMGDAELTIVGGQMANYIADVACATAFIQNVSISNLYLILIGNAQGIQACGTGFRISDNTIIAPAPTGTAIGIHIMNAGQIPGLIQHNLIAYADYGIFSEPSITTSGGTLVSIKDNYLVGSIVSDYSINATDTGFQIIDMFGRAYAKLPQCNASITDSEFLVTDVPPSPLPTYLGATSGGASPGGGVPIPSICNGVWANH